MFFSGQAGDDLGALACWEEALEADPRNGELHFLLGSARARTGDAVRAADAYRSAIACGFTKSCVHDMLAKSLFTAGDKDGAMMAWEVATEVNPRDHEAHASLGP